ncbi:hypothetical protein RHMOL_Rhmol06G0145800 [Rhododendron molle]|uniref:Uncharacterized protein n=2 Tax=Rhododendron molle TaxID=49168 RepID=A0ACC0NDX3_RHOML|nr:hypothetical protein RHMOL_Rhmol06G0145800 [Rhododendron molle]KAI8550937.1 hypothetical protein RHMOL_Rhmol06G0145800 [Rhododendron molle]
MVARICRFGYMKSLSIWLYEKLVDVLLLTARTCRGNGGCWNQLALISTNSRVLKALDKIRFLSLTDKEILGEGDDAKLEIQIKLDKANKILSIRDRGIGMTKEDLIKNLGTIAKSGTSGIIFLLSLRKCRQVESLILLASLMLGVGFYLVYFLADYVEVISKNNDDKQYVWESKADATFAVSEDPWNELLGCGT